MPQASDQLRKWAIERFGDIDNIGPHDLLLLRGFRIANKWAWISPYKKDHQLSEEELNAINFLMQEWDYDGIVSYEGADPDPFATLNQSAAHSS